MEEKKLAEKISPERIQEFPIKVMYVDPQNETIPHRHDFVELALIERGASLHEFNGVAQEVKPGDILLIPRGVDHAYRQCTPDFALVNILFIPEALPLSRLDSFLLPGFKIIMEQGEFYQPSGSLLHCDSGEFQLLSNLTHQMLLEDQERTPGYIFTMQGAFMMILGHLARLLAQNISPQQDRLAHLSQALAYLNKHFTAPLDIAYLCRISGMSRPSFQRNFLQATGTTPLQYLLKLRLTEGATLLRMTDKPLGEIAYTLGFADGNYFSRMFKRQLGMTPGAYRKSVKLQSS